ncbi:hypothetical protein SBA5_590033 [Candidatus Sulfotelmatomonas gaucii]|uniref:Uncharacterized protein n=1 Tax=Candidatus Sulfuritelmatomonas gaucii TaxID=2043161 RepID=A0A2N9LVQ9_9BACT|nr:hypothetical protein SBA5_590033 [Candidatus Sulfotelmatomonas gaucii]
MGGGEAGEDSIGASRKTEERRYERNCPVYGLDEVMEENSYGDIACSRRQSRCDSDPVAALSREGDASENSPIVFSQC